MKAPLDRLVDEAKEDFVPKQVDWDRVDDALFARIADERAKPVDLSRKRSTPFGRLRVIGTSIAFAAAAAALFTIGSRRSSVEHVESANRATANAGRASDANKVVAVGSLRTANGAVRIGGKNSVSGVAIANDDAIETAASASAIFVSEGPSAEPIGAPRGASPIAVGVDSDSRVSIRGDRAEWSLTLERGALEANVANVTNAANGGNRDAATRLSIDVDGTRVATSGSRLRIARGDRITVDVSEGSVSIGDRSAQVADRATVLGPAHVEFDGAHAKETMRVSRDPARIAARRVLDVSVASGDVPGAKPAPESVNRAAPASPPKQTNEGPGSSANGANETNAPNAPNANAVTASSGKSPQADNAPPELSIARAVEACFASSPRASASNEVTVTVNSILTLTLADDGSVQSARFSPPLPPEVQTCAAQTIYKTRFSRGGNVDVPLRFKH